MQKMSTNNEVLRTDWNEEHIDGLDIYSFPPVKIRSWGETTWTRFKAGASIFDVRHHLPGTYTPKESVEMRWRSSIIPSELPTVLIGLPREERWIYSSQGAVRPLTMQLARTALAEKGQFVCLENKGALVKSTVGHEEWAGIFSVEVNYNKGARDIGHFVEMLADRTADTELLPHLPLIMAREQALFV
jgi:hypothetical protein